jgi:hypothetical protein
VYPGGNGVTMNVGGEGGPGPPGGREDEQLVSSSGDRDVHRMLEDKKTGSARHQSFIMHRVCIIVCVNLL